MQRAHILVVGGYGVVGGRVARHLAAAFPERVLIAGRDQGRASRYAISLGHGVGCRHLDTDNPQSIDAALERVGTVVMCVAQRDYHVLRMAVARGISYTDIAPRLAFWHGADELNATAQRTGACVMLGAGLSPGISNAMAAKLSSALGRLDHIETAILLSLGDEYGPDSMRHVLESVAQPFSLLEAGRTREALPFSEGRNVRFPEPLGSRTAYLFPWSDVVYYPKTLGVSSAIGRFALDPPWAGRTASLLVAAGGHRWLSGKSPSQRGRRAIEALKRLAAGHDRFALVVTAQGSGRTMSMSLAGRHQSDATAAGAAELARLLASRQVHRPGVWWPEQIVQPDAFFQAIAAHGLRPQLDAVESSQASGELRHSNSAR